TVQVEVRKKRVFVKRDELAAEGVSHEDAPDLDDDVVADVVAEAVEQEAAPVEPVVAHAEEARSEAQAQAEVPEVMAEVPAEPEPQPVSEPEPAPEPEPVPAAVAPDVVEASGDEDAQQQSADSETANAPRKMRVPAPGSILSAEEKAARERETK